MRTLYLICYISLIASISFQQTSSIDSITEEDTSDEFDEFRDEEEETNPGSVPDPNMNKNKVTVPGKIVVSGAESSISLEHLWEHILKTFLPDEVITFEVPPRSQEV